MSKIQFINTYPADKRYTYDERIALLRARKVAQTEEKAKKGGADEDDYGLIEQDVYKFELEANHENGSIYGYRAWRENYTRLIGSHPLYCDPIDAFVGKGFVFMERLRPKQHKWNPAYPFDDLKKIFDKYNIISGIDNCHHFTPDLQIGFDLGWGGILEQLKLEREKHSQDHHEFYDSEIAVVEAIIAFLYRASDELLELSKIEKNPQLSQNLLEMSRVHHLKYQSKSQPELILNLFQHGLIAKGVNITDGGANYYNMCVDGSGLAVVADSFAALEQRIEREKKLTYDELDAHIKANYEDKDGEYIRQLMLHSERYGGGNSLGDSWAERIKDLYTELVRDLCEQHKGINFIPGFFSWSNTILLGKSVGATPNGRKSGEPINHGANPCGNFRPDGAVTSMCNSIARVQPAFGNTAPVQLEVDPGIANDEEGIRKMAAMIKTIMNTGNTLLNINIIDTEKILEAHKDPFKYPDLVVRVTGFTAYFAMLSPEFRQLVVDRITSVNPRQLKENDFNKQKEK
ncbi:MAG: hypothetical protein E7670_05925 [Ruminococcaceae bacterium]|nr:hypothetical protein [Oscillospiraceae bacterium]